MQQLQYATSTASRLAHTVAQLACDASIEINVHDLADLDASRALLPLGQRVYISHLPKQRWDETLSACQRVSAAGFDPIPHMPVRLIDSAARLDELLGLAARAQVKEILMIAGDYAHACGPYSAVADVLRSGKLSEHGFTRLSLAGHPEGHPTVPLDEIRRAEVEKAALAASFATRFVTQFFFEAPPFLQWASALRARGIGQVQLVAGLAGPAGIATLLKLARRCGVGPSIRALVTRPNAFAKLIGEHGPEDLMLDLAAAYELDASTFSGLHFFCFGGYLRTCEWLNRCASAAGINRQLAAQ